MTKFKLEGQYKSSFFPSGKGRLEGEIITTSKNSTCSFEGELNDFNSHHKNYFLKGHIVVYKHSVDLVSLRIKSDEQNQEKKELNKSSFLYMVNKPGNTIEGQYKGKWRNFVNSEFVFDKNTNLFLKQIKIQSPNLNDNLTLNLYKI